MAMLFQLSYSPFELETGRQLYARALTVQRRLQPQINRAPPGDHVDRNKVAAVEWLTVDSDEVDLVGCVRAMDVACRREAVAPQGDPDHGSRRVERTPLALHPQQSIANLKSQVIAPVLDDRSEDGDPELCGRGGDGGLGDPTFLVGGQHERMFAPASGKWSLTVETTT
jgi:hypothetical protein